MAVEVDVVYEGKLTCAATHGPSQNTIHTTAPADNGGTGDAFSPTDLVGTSLAACMLTIMGLAADREQIDIAGTRVHVVKEMAPTLPRRIGKLTVQITLPAGRNFSPKVQQKLRNAAMACPVKQSLHPDIELDLTFDFPE